jgi:hypothetical protein
MQRDAESPDAYRNVILDVAPCVEEPLRHGMLDYPGLANLGAQKHYVALYVMPVVLARHRRAFSGVDAGKSCLRYLRRDQVDPRTVRELLEDVLRERGSG